VKPKLINCLIDERRSEERNYLCRNTCLYTAFRMFHKTSKLRCQTSGLGVPGVLKTKPKVQCKYSKKTRHWKSGSRKLNRGGSKLLILCIQRASENKSILDKLSLLYTVTLRHHLDLLILKYIPTSPNYVRIPTILHRTIPSRPYLQPNQQTDFFCHNLIPAIELWFFWQNLINSHKNHTVLS